MRFTVLLALALFVVAGATPLSAGGFGIQFSYNNFADGDPSGDGFSIDGDQTDFGIGARIVFGGNIHFIGSFDYYFIGEDVLDVFNTKFYEYNGNLAYAFPTLVIRPYVGGGLGLARISFDGDQLDDSASELGVNVLGGVRFEIPIFSPFFELRYTFYSGDETLNNRFIVTGGILF